MGWYVNDSSLDGQYATAALFVDDLEKLLSLRASLPELRSRLYCSRELSKRSVAVGFSFRRAIEISNNKILKNTVLSWLSMAGPFWDDDRTPISDDYFECNGIDVTDQGVGEAARRCITSNPACVYSFRGGGYDYSPLSVVHGLPEEPLGHLDVPNLWSVPDLRLSVQKADVRAVNWQQMLDEAGGRFEMVKLIANCGDSLKPEPFNRYVASRVFELLKVLDDIALSMKESGQRTAESNRLTTLYFSGGNALFSDESASNKRDFEKQLNFADPDSPGTKVSCTWHGKIQTPPFRIHFEWPPVPRRKIRVFYIGPKITKS